MLTFSHRSNAAGASSAPLTAGSRGFFASGVVRIAFTALLLLIAWAPAIAAGEKESLDKRMQLQHTNESASPAAPKKKKPAPAVKEPVAPIAFEAPIEYDLDANGAAPGKPAAAESAPTTAPSRIQAPLTLPKQSVKKDSIRNVLEKDAATMIKEPKTPRVFSMPEGPLTLDECISMALQQSPYFVQSAMEIKLKQIDESDSWYKLLPDIQVRTGYIIASSRSIDSPYILNFSTANWDPISAGFGIKAAKLVTEVAILGHLKSISTGIENLGTIFLEISFFDQLAVCQDELVSLAQKEKDYLTNLLNTGGSSALEIRIAEQQLEIAKLERDKIEADRRDRIDKMKTVIGVDVNCNLRLDLKKPREQLLRGFDPAKATLAEVQSNSLDLIIQRHLVQMQEYNIKLAYARFLPQFYFETRTSDPVDTNRSGLYSSVGFNWTIWDWGSRNRNVTRQELTREKVKVKEDLTSLELGANFRSAVSLYGRSQSAVKLAQAQVELAKLRKQRSEINYQGGSQPFPVLLQQVREFFIAKKNTLAKEMENVKVAFAIRHISGDLYNTYIDAKPYTSKIQ